MSDNDDDEFVTSFPTCNVRDTFKKEMVKIRQQAANQLKVDKDYYENLTSRLKLSNATTKSKDSANMDIDPLVEKCRVDTKTQNKLLSGTDLMQSTLLEEKNKLIPSVDIDKINTPILKGSNEEMIQLSPSKKEHITTVLECFLDEDNDLLSAVPDTVLDSPKVTSSLSTVQPNTNNICTVSSSGDQDDDLFYLVPDEVLDNTVNHDDPICITEVIQIQSGSKYNTRSKKRPLTLPPTRNKKRRCTRNSQKKNKITDKEIYCVDEKSIEKETVQTDCDDEFNYETNVKIMWKSVNLIKIPVRRLQKLVVVFEHMMKLENVSIDRVLLTLNGVAIRHSDTPHSLDLKICDFLEGGIVNSGGSASLARTGQRKMVHKSMINIKFQSGDKNHHFIAANPSDKMIVLMVGYSEQIDKPLHSLTFEFDGLPVSPDKTLKDMEMENNDVIDVKFAQE